jgi:hypothetical protein
VQEHAIPYLQRVTGDVKLKISEALHSENSAAIAEKVVAFHFSDKTSLAFQDYYVATIANRQHFLNSKDFFLKFKKMYSLQGIDRAYLGSLERQKESLLDHLDRNDLVAIYLDYFAYASIRHGSKFVTKNLASFFAKFVHTFKPADFCALDNPIKNYFGLSREGFYLSFLMISSAYQSWISENVPLMTQVRHQLELHETARRYSSKMTDLKLLDLIFWLKANKPALIN